MDYSTIVTVVFVYRVLLFFKRQGHFVTVLFVYRVLLFFKRQGHFV
jgi:hypothetical protein